MTGVSAEYRIDQETGDWDIVAPEPDRSVFPSDESGAYEAAYSHYRELYPSLYGQGVSRSH